MSYDRHSLSLIYFEVVQTHIKFSWLFFLIFISFADCLFFASFRLFCSWYFYHIGFSPWRLNINWEESIVDCLPFSQRNLFRLHFYQCCGKYCFCRRVCWRFRQRIFKSSSSISLENASNWVRKKFELIKTKYQMNNNNSTGMYLRKC